jgi:hypothetical protein
VPCEAAKEFGVVGHAAHMNLKKGKAILERGELLKELFLGELLFRETAFAFVVSVDKTFHDDAPCVGLGYATKPNIGRSEAAAWPAHRPSNQAITRRPRPV